MPKTKARKNRTELKMKKLTATLNSLRTEKNFFLLWDILSVTAASLTAAAICMITPDTYRTSPVLRSIPLTILTTVLFFMAFRMYSAVWAYASLPEFFLLVFASVLSVSTALVFSSVFDAVYGSAQLTVPMPAFYVVFFFLLVILTLTARFAVRLRSGLGATVPTVNSIPVMVIGAGSGGSVLIRELNSGKLIKGAKAICVIDDDIKKQGKFIQGVPIVGRCENIPKAAEKYSVKEIVIAIPSLTAGRRRDILGICSETSLRVRIMPGVSPREASEGSGLREVNIADLLGRKQIRTPAAGIAASVNGKTVLVTGGGGSIGSEICRQVAGYAPKKLILLDIYENNAYETEQQLKRKYPELDLEVIIASDRDRRRLYSVFSRFRPDIIYHAAAHKHVPLMEKSPCEAIKNNVFGTLNAALAASSAGVGKFVLISSDKAVNPTNIMGATKRICEMIIQTVGKDSGTDFAAVRFGNVLGSNGSVIPLFRRQIADGGPVTVTHPDIIRYFMTVEEAVSLVLTAGAFAGNGEIYVLDMGKPVKIYDLAVKLIKLSGYMPNTDIKIEFTGLRPGEKLYEELLMSEEGLKKTENELIFIGKPVGFDVVKFREQLEELGKAAETEPENICQLIAEIVPTYRPGSVTATESAGSENFPGR